MRRLSAALALAALAGCAGHRAAAPRDLSDAELASAAPRQVALAGFARWLENDAAGAGRRFDEALRRDGADPWARLGAAFLARRGLEDVEEARHLLLLVQRAPGHPLAASVTRRLGDLAERSPSLADAIEAGLSTAAPRLEGLAAMRARAARAQAAEAVGDSERAARLRAENGSVTAWTLVGPFSAYHALELDRPFAPEQGPLPAAAEGPPGVGPLAARALPVPDGVVSLDPEPATRGDVFYLAADLTAARGGDYLVALGAIGSALAWLDGAPLAARRVHAGFPPSTQVVPFRLSPGTHRLLVKVARGATGASRLAVAVARADGAPSDVAPVPAAAGTPAAAVRPGAPPGPVNLAGALLARLEPEAGAAVARLVAAREAMDSDREAAKALLEEALASHPRAAPLLLARAESQADDGTLGERTARARAEATLERTLAADPGDASARLARAEFMRTGDRLDDAQSELQALPEAAARRPRALLARARVSLARGFAEGAEALAEEAQRGSGTCAAGELLLEQAQRRDEAARTEELARALVRCPGGRERLADHLRRRGDAAGSRDLLLALARAAPARLDRRLELARALAAAGDPAAAAAELADLARLWPREPRIEKRRADFLELAGDRAGARAAREQALRLDGGDLGLRRLLDRERGVETLADLSEDGRAAWEAWRKDGLRDASGVYALDHAAVEAAADGSLLERTHQVVAVLDQRAVDRFGEVPLPQGAEMILARTLKPDGRVLEAEERGEKGTVSLPGLEPGDAAEFAWLRALPARGPALPGFTSERFYFRGDLPMWRSAYAVAAPAGTALVVDARRLPQPPVAREGAREVLRVSAEKVPAFHAEPGTPAESEFLPMVHAGAGAGPEALAPALADALADCCRPTLEVGRLAREVAASLPAGRRGSEALARAAYARVAELVQGQGGPLADQASQVLARGRGSRILLLAAVLEALGVRSRLALAREFVRDPGPSSFPRTDAYAHPLLRVELEGGRVAWLDPGLRQVPFGALPQAVRGAEAVVVGGPGEAPRWEPVPPDDGAPQRHVKLSIRLAEDGTAEVEGIERHGGFEGASTKASLERLDPQRRREAMEQLLSRGFRGAALSVLEFEGEGDAEAPLTIRWKATAPGWARAGAGQLVADVPVQAARLSARFAQRGAREAPLLLGGSERFTVALEVTPPPGWSPVAREGAEVRTPYGRYRRSERVQGGKLLRDDEFALERGRIPPGEWGAFGDFAAGVDEAQAQPMVFLATSPGVAATPRPGSAKWAGALGMEAGRGGHGP